MIRDCSEQYTRLQILVASYFSFIISTQNCLSLLFSPTTSITMLMLLTVSPNRYFLMRESFSMMVSPPKQLKESQLLRKRVSQGCNASIFQKQGTSPVISLISSSEQVRRSFHIWYLLFRKQRLYLSTVSSASKCQILQQSTAYFSYYSTYSPSIRKKMSSSLSSRSSSIFCLSCNTTWKTQSLPSNRVSKCSFEMTIPSLVILLSLSYFPSLSISFNLLRTSLKKRLFGLARMNQFSSPGNRLMAWLVSSSLMQVMFPPCEQAEQAPMRISGLLDILLQILESLAIDCIQAKSLRKIAFASMHIPPYLQRIFIFKISVLSQSPFSYALAIIFSTSSRLMYSSMFLLLTSFISHPFLAAKRYLFLMLSCVTRGAPSYPYSQSTHMILGKGRPSWQLRPSTKMREMMQ